MLWSVKVILNPKGKNYFLLTVRLFFIESGDEQDNTCLHLAAVHGHHHILSYLLNKGFIRVNQTNR